MTFREQRISQGPREMCFVLGGGRLVFVLILAPDMKKGERQGEGRPFARGPYFGLLGVSCLLTLYDVYFL